MIRILSLFLFLFAMTAQFALADPIPSNLQKSICQAGTTVKSSGMFFSRAGAQEEFGKLVGSTNFCTNEVVTLQGLSLSDQVTCICRNQQEYDSVGCGAGKTEPTVTTIISRSQSECATDAITISKCVTDPEAAYKAACASGQNILRASGAGSSAAPLQMPAPAAALPAPAQNAQPAGTPAPSPVQNSPAPAPSPAPSAAVPQWPASTQPLGLSSPEQPSWTEMTAGERMPAQPSGLADVETPAPSSPAPAPAQTTPAPGTSASPTITYVMTRQNTGGLQDLFGSSGNSLGMMSMFSNIIGALQKALSALFAPKTTQPPTVAPQPLPLAPSPATTTASSTR